MYQEEARWWPVDADNGRAPMRSGDAVYALLGPASAHLLRAALRELIDNGVPLSDQIRDLSEELDRADGRRPDMLILMASAAAALRAQNGFLENPDDLLRELLDQRYIDQAYKLFGWLVEEAAAAFGFTHETFLEYVSTQWRHYGEGAWPPAGARYTNRAPQGHSDAQLMPGDPECAPGDSDPLTFWLDIAKQVCGRPSLIGAHLVRFDVLDRYTAELELALKYVEQDLKQQFNLADTDVATRELREAVSQVAEGRRLIFEAQDTIVGYFPT
jgi:hypothetical protein